MHAAAGMSITNAEFGRKGSTIIPPCLRTLISSQKKNIRNNEL